MNVVKEYLVIGNKIRSLLNENKMSQVDLAMRLGVSKPAISSWVNGLRAPNRLNCKKMEKLFGTDKGYFDAELTQEEQEIKHFNLNGVDIPVSTKKRAEKRLMLLQQALDMLQSKEINEETFNNILSKIDLNKF